MNALTIHIVCKEDLPILFKFRNDPSFIQYCISKKTQLTFEEFNEELRNSFLTNKQAQFIISLNQKPIGTIWIYDTVRSLSQSFISIFLQYEYRKKGYGIYALSRVIKYIFEEMGIGSVFADVYESNLLSVSTLEKRGWNKVVRHFSVREKNYGFENISRYKLTANLFFSSLSHFAEKCIFKRP